MLRLATGRGALLNARQWAFSAAFRAVSSSGSGSASLNSVIEDAREAEDRASTAGEEAGEAAAAAAAHLVKTQQKYIRASPRRLNLLCSQVRACGVTWWAGNAWRRRRHLLPRQL